MPQKAPRVARGKSLPGSMHIHIGLGRLGLGLVLGLIRVDMPLVVLQRKGSRWSLVSTALARKGVVTLENTADFKRNIRVHDWNGLSGSDKEGVGRDVSGSALIFYDILDDVSALLQRCSTMTISVGPEGQEEVGRWLDQHGGKRPVTVFPFENVITLQSKVHTVRKVIPDRICPRPVDCNEHTGVVSVAVERYAQVVVNAPETECREVFGEAVGKEVVVAEEIPLFEYYRSRKRHLVNGLHYVLATLGYSRLREHGIPVREWPTQYLPLLIEGLLSDDSEMHHNLTMLIGAEAMRSVIEARGLLPRLRDRVFAELNEEQLYLTLCEYAQRNIQRFKKPTDPLTRIINVDNVQEMADKYKEHIAGLQRFVSWHSKDIEDFPARLRPWKKDIDHVIAALTEVEHDVWATLLVEKAKAG